MTVRILSAAVALPLFFVVIYFLPPVCFTIAIAILSIIGVYELLWRSKIVDCVPLMAVAYFMAVAVPAWAHFGFPSVYTLPAVFLLVVCVFLIWMGQQDKVGFGMAAQTLFGAIVIPLFLSSTIGILHTEHGKFMILVPFIAAWMTDTGAYFCGVFLGKHKLAPRISPKKTVEGAIGGVIVCILSFLLYGVVMAHFFDIGVSYLMLGLSGLVLSPIAEIGDLSLSLIKREYNIKDYGVIFPGHGGILDRFDSVLFTAPATLVLLNMLTLTF